MENMFIKLEKVAMEVSKKGTQKLNYITWADAWTELKKLYPTATFTVHENSEGLPYFKDSSGGFVKVSVTANEITHTCWLPIMDYANKTIPVDKITSFDVIKTQQRTLAKAIALFGLGLYVYRGEDVPTDAEEPVEKKCSQEVKKSFDGVKLEKPADSFVCCDCYAVISEKVKDYSESHYGAHLCFGCQAKEKQRLETLKESEISN